MTFEEYLDFLDEYWDLFGPPPQKPYSEFKNIKI